MTNKTYKVWYTIKANGTETLHNMTVTAANAKEAKTICKSIVFERSGRNAFRPSTVQPKPYDNHHCKRLRNVVCGMCWDDHEIELAENRSPCK